MVVGVVPRTTLSFSYDVNSDTGNLPPPVVVMLTKSRHFVIHFGGALDKL